MQKTVAADVVALAGRDLATLSEAAARPGFKAVPLGVTVDLAFANTVRRFASKNVVGLLPGRERPGETVLYTAHWDHLGRCKADASGDDICNGAVDNATGSAALVALAEAAAKAGPAARSQAFVAFTAEEAGLIGAEYYGANPVFPLDHTVGGVNMDAMLPTGPARDIGVIGGGKSTLDGTLQTAVAAQGRAMTGDPRPEQGKYYRSDHFALAKRGVPMLYLKNGSDLVTGGKEAGQAFAADYTANRYHAPSDEYDAATWDWTGIVRDLELLSAIGRALATGEDWPNWLEGDEFRKVRDANCAAATGGCRP